MKVIITGSTGMVGKGVLLECLESADVEQVLIINRQSVGITHSKLKEIIHQDFSNLSSIKNEMSGFDACFFCLGVSSVGMNEVDYSKLTYDLALEMAKTLVTTNPNMLFNYVSGTGTDSSEKGRIMWARVKGKTENAILALFPKSLMFRPGFIQPMKGVKSKVKLYQFFIVLFKPIYSAINYLIPKYITNTVKVGKAMINSVKYGFAKKHLENRDINQLAEKGA